MEERSFNGVGCYLKLSKHGYNIFSAMKISSALMIFTFPLIAENFLFKFCIRL